MSPWLAHTPGAPRTGGRFLLRASSSVHWLKIWGPLVARIVSSVCPSTSMMAGAFLVVWAYSIASIPEFFSLSRSTNVPATGASGLGDATLETRIDSDMLSACRGRQGICLVWQGICLGRQGICLGLGQGFAWVLVSTGLDSTYTLRTSTSTCTRFIMFGFASECPDTHTHL